MIYLNHSAIFILGDLDDCKSYMQTVGWIVEKWPPPTSMRTLINWKFIPQKSTTTNENPTILMIHLGPCDKDDEDGEDGDDGGGGSEDDDHLV